MPIDPDERRKYIEAYGKPAWIDAVGKANGHRSRAKNDYGLTEHFTATEWLDLCADWDFRCAYCRTVQEGFLTPHHLLPLSQRGDNEIGNILPICRECHIFIHDFGINCHTEWLPTQFALCERFEVGDLVQYSPKRASIQREPMGVVMEVVPPTRRVSLFELVDNPSYHESHANGCAVIDLNVTYWTRSRARVDWAWCSQHMSPNQYDLVDLEDVKKVNVQTYMASLNQAHVEQSRICAEQYQLMHQFMHQFSVGDWVEYGDPDGPQQGVLLKITPPMLHAFDFPLVDAKDLHLVEWPYVTPAGAHLKWLTRKRLPGRHPVHVSLENIRKAKNIPEVDERWVKEWEAWKSLTKPRLLRQAIRAAKEAARRKS